MNTLLNSVFHFDKPFQLILFPKIRNLKFLDLVVGIFLLASTVKCNLYTSSIIPDMTSPATIKSNSIPGSRIKDLNNNGHLYNYFPKSQQSPQIFINQSNNIYILAKYGQTISLPCIIIRQKNQELSNIHAVWHKLVDRQRPIVLSVGTQQLKQDMRYRVKQIILNDYSKIRDHASEERLVYEDKISKQKKQLLSSEIISNQNDQYFNENNDNYSNKNKYSVENWQFEIRRLNYGDAGTYQCLLPLVKPTTKNVTLQVIPDLIIEPKEGNYKLEEKIMIKCKATIKSYRNSKSKNSVQHLHQRQQKSVINWYKENEIIKMESTNSHNNKKIEINTNHEEHVLRSVLIINNAKLEDSGRYRCIYDNIQEQIIIKVSNENYEYKNYLATSNSSFAIQKMNFIQNFIFVITALCYKNKFFV